MARIFRWSSDDGPAATSTRRVIGIFIGAVCIWIAVGMVIDQQSGRLINPWIDAVVAVAIVAVGLRAITRSFGAVELGVLAAVAFVLIGGQTTGDYLRFTQQATAAAFVLACVVSVRSWLAVPLGMIPAIATIPVVWGRDARTGEFAIDSLAGHLGLAMAGWVIAGWLYASAAVRDQVAAEKAAGEEAELASRLRSAELLRVQRLLHDDVIAALLAAAEGDRSKEDVGRRACRDAVDAVFDISGGV